MPLHSPKILFLGVATLLVASLGRCDAMPIVVRGLITDEADNPLSNVLIELNCPRKARASARPSAKSATSIGFAEVKPPESSGPQIIVERLERATHDEVQFRVRVTNRTDRPIFLTAVNYKLMGFKGQGAYLDPLYLEQWRTKEGWSIVAPCMDTPPPHVIKLNPGETMATAPVLQLPLPSVCKVRNIQLEGKFRFRLDYFESEKQARAYIDKLFSPRWKEAYNLAAVSEPFEIPPPQTRDTKSP